jgi:uncharacterized damage-inducible protein DinB
MTLDTPRLLARYNTQTNAEMNRILATLTPEEWEADRGGYFSSFRSLTGHLYTADVHWLVRFTGRRPFAAVKGEVFDFPPSFGQPPFATLGEYLAARPGLDACIEAFVAELTEADLAADLDYRNSRGEAFTKNFGGLVLHMFNHQTHHRGMVSLYLDQMKKANDYSNLTSLL